MIPSWPDRKEDRVVEVNVSQENESSVKHYSTFNPQLGNPQSNYEKTSCGLIIEPLRKQNFRQFLQSLRESESNSSGPWSASCRDQTDTADDEGFVVAQTRSKKKKKSKIFAKNNDENVNKNLESPHDESKEVGCLESKKLCDEIEKLESVFEDVKVGISGVKKSEPESQVQMLETESTCDLNRFMENDSFSKDVQLKESSKIGNTEKTRREQAWLCIPRTNSNRIIESEECPICYAPLLKNKIILEECGHCFHSECIRLWMKQKKTCPFCTKFSLPPDEFPRLGEIRPNISD